MAITYLYQIIFCTQRDKRAFRREIAVSETSCMIVRAEMLPPGYDLAMAHMRDPGEEILTVHGATLPAGPEYHGCPFCGNINWVTCACGAMSCLGRDAKIHSCPRCGNVSAPVAARETSMSKSGFIDGQKSLADYFSTIVVRQSGGPPAVRPRADVPAAKAAGSGPVDMDLVNKLLEKKGG